MKPNVKQFARFILEKEGLLDWTVVSLAGGGGYCSKENKEIRLGGKATYGLALHEIAHALDENPPTIDGHWGYHADLLHQLADKYMEVSDFAKEIHLD